MGFTTVDVPGAGTGPGQGTVLISINDSGVIVGAYIDASGVYHAFVYSQESGGGQQRKLLLAPEQSRMAAAHVSLVCRAGP